LHPLRIAVLVVVAIVAVSDLAVGIFLLASHEPWRAHGPGTVWSESAALASIPAVASLYRRLGAFSLYAGVMTLVFAGVGARHRPTLTALLFGYAIVGVAFFATDTAYFRGTAYYSIKQAFGALWMAAIVMHLIEGRKR
jgi:hypothetical protein